MSFKLLTWIISGFIVWICVFGFTNGLVQIISSKGNHRIENEFLIVVKKSDFQRITQGGQDFDWIKFKEDLMEKASLVVKHVITFGDFKAAMVEANVQQLEALLEDADIDFIEMNQKIRYFKRSYPDIRRVKADPWSVNSSYCLVENTGSDMWGLSRLNQREALDVNSRLTYSWLADEDGSGVNAYVMDSGIFVEHSEFEGRAKHGFTSASIAQFEDERDLHGHGTHVAGTIGGKTFGVAKGVNLIAVKVLDRHGEGTIVDLLQGLQFIYNDHTNKQADTGGKVKSVVNLSLGAEGSAPVMEQAIALLIEEGIPMVVASGNEYRDACEFTPSKIDVAITVGSTTIKDYMSPFSNYGPCVDILAPGSDILSAWSDSPTSIAYASGTSMSAPHVAGVVARYLSHWNDEEETPLPSEIKQYLLDTATMDRIDLNVGPARRSVSQSTPNVLLNAHCGLEVFSNASGTSTRCSCMLWLCLSLLVSCAKILS